VTAGNESRGEVAVDFSAALLFSVQSAQSVAISDYRNEIMIVFARFWSIMNTRILATDCADYAEKTTRESDLLGVTR
jgi:hypothetical protein